MDIPLYIDEIINVKQQAYEIITFPKNTCTHILKDYPNINRFFWHTRTTKTYIYFNSTCDIEYYGIVKVVRL